jgi:hypothetical protein
MGQTEQPLSYFFDSYVDVWRDGRYLPMRSVGLPSYSKLTMNA